ncbi:MAG TPA: hypothetical protein DDY78_04350 [Planctomycetales bacterium]|nr:hypothetical protein [Planctomycetales bacterium]
MSVSSTAPPLTLPADVVAFAAENGVADYLPRIAEMTQQVFSHAASISVLLQDDPDIADNRTIVFEMDVAGFEVEQLVAAQHRWTAALFQHCPATHVHFFVPGLWASA